MDVLTDVLTAVREGRAVASATVARAPWGLRFADPVGMVFHVALHGTTWLTPDGGDPVRLSAGDVVLLPDPRPHVLSDRPGRPAVDFGAEMEEVVGSVTRVRLPGAGDESRLVCGAYLLQDGRSHPLLRGMPQIVHVPMRAGSELGTALGLLRAEIDRHGPGSAAAVASLVDALLVYILRAHFAARPDGWSRALTDPEIAAALRLIHGSPADPWSVTGLAHEVGMSRAPFARRFGELVGEPPMAYVTRWRMTTAAGLLREGSAPVAAIGRQVGYTSEFAFSRAFRRFHGVPPSTFRTRERASDK